MIHFRIWQLGRQEQRDLLQRMHKPTAKTCTLMFRNIQLTHIGQHHTGSLASRTLHKNFFHILRSNLLHEMGYCFRGETRGEREGVTKGNKV